MLSATGQIGGKEANRSFCLAGVTENYKEEMWFPMAVIINNHKLGGLNHQKFVLSQS